MKSNLQTRLGAWALISLLCFAIVPTVGCSGTTVAQDIVNWTPTIVSAATTIDGVVATLDPQNALLITAVGVSFTAAANLVEAQAKTYLANPTATALQQLQFQAQAFQSNINAAFLAAMKITNSASQQRILTALNAGVTGISAILALITTIKGATVTPASVTAPKVAQVIPLLNREQDVAIVAVHYGWSQDQALVAYNDTMARLQAAGL